MVDVMSYLMQIRNSYEKVSFTGSEFCSSWLYFFHLNDHIITQNTKEDMFVSLSSVESRSKFHGKRKQ